MEQGYDEELEKLLGEIPRATSAPPHLEEIQRAQHHQPQEVQPSFAAKDMSHDAASIMAHFPLLYKPFTEPHPGAVSPSSLPMTTTSAYDVHGVRFDDADDPPNHLSPGYNGVLSGSYNVRCRRSIDHHNTEHQSVDHTEQQHNALSHGRQSADPDLVSDARLSSNNKPHLEQASLNEDMCLNLQSDSHAYMDHDKGTRQSNTMGSSHSSPISHPNAMHAVSSVPESPSYDSHLPSSLLVDPFLNNVPEIFENDLRNELEKLSLSRNGLDIHNRNMQQPPGISVLCNGQIPLEVQGTGQFSEQNFGFMESPVTGATTMQLGFQHPSPNRSYTIPLSAGMLSPYQSAWKMVYAQQMHEAASAAHAQQQLEERMHCRQRIKEEFLLRQQKLQEQQARFYASLYNQSPPAYNRSHLSAQSEYRTSLNSCNLDFIQPQASSKTLMGNSFPSDGLWPASAMLSRETSQTSNLCRYFLHGFCTRGDLCPFSHSHTQSGSVSPNNGLILSESSLSRTRKGPRSVQTTPALVMPTSKTKSNGHSNGHILSNGTHLSSPSQLTSINGGVAWKGLSPEILQSVNSQQLLSPQQQSPPPPKYTSLKEVEGHIYGIAKDQHGCRFLQRKFEEGVFEDVQKIFVEIIDHVVELMTDPFGNYLVQKLLEVCDESQRMEILYRVTGNGQLVTISLNMHGTRAVQKLIETLKSPEQVALVISSLQQGVVTLIKDLNGNHVVQRCLQRLSTEDSQFIFDAAAAHCVEIATHRHGCCVLQRCVDFSAGQQRACLVAEIAANALVLSQDPFGNYVVQYILDLGLAWAISEVIVRLDGNFVHLAMQKFSSNVVEKCLKLGDEESKSHIIKELMNSTRLAQLLQDPFANYVVQSALTVSKGPLHFGLVEAIRPHLPALRSSPYGKRILSRTSLKK